MSWARYDDEFPMNRKVGKLIALGQSGLAAIGLHLLANTYARHNGTKGVIELHVPTLLAGRHGRKLATILEDVGMFEPHSSGGWVIHDYQEFHDPSDPDPDRSAADRKKELSEKRAASGRLGGLAKGKQRFSNATDLLLAKGVAKGVAKDKQTPSPDPVPDPLGTSTLTTHPPSPVGRGGGGPTIEAIAGAAGRRHGTAEANAGRATNAEGLAAWKSRALLADERQTLEALVAESAEHQQRSGQHIPISVLADAALGHTKGLAGYRAAPSPVAELDTVKLTREQRTQMIAESKATVTQIRKETA